MCAKTNVTKIHTLGPKGTNCELAAHQWCELNNVNPEIVLHSTLEDAVDIANFEDQEALLACIVYPNLHHLVFSNLDKMRLLDCFVMPTYNMVLASLNTKKPKRIASHPAPISLLNNLDWTVHPHIYSTSNTQAAISCKEYEVDGCITTLKSAHDFGLKVIRDFGPVDMGFSIHVAAA